MQTNLHLSEKLFTQVRLQKSVCDRPISYFELHLPSILMYILSTIGVSKESTIKFLIGNRFHVKLRILSPYSNRISPDSSKAYRKLSALNCFLYCFWNSLCFWCFFELRWNWQTYSSIFKDVNSPQFFQISKCIFFRPIRIVHGESISFFTMQNNPGIPNQLYMYWLRGLCFVLRTSMPVIRKQ